MTRIHKRAAKTADNDRIVELLAFAHEAERLSTDQDLLSAFIASHPTECLSLAGLFIQQHEKRLVKSRKILEANGRFSETEVVAMRQRRANGELATNLADEFKTTIKDLLAICRGDKYAMFGGPRTKVGSGRRKTQS